MPSLRAQAPSCISATIDARGIKLKKRYSHIFFDLDGTLTDSKDGIFNAILYSLNRFGIIEHNTDKLNAFIGPPLLRSYREIYGMSEKDSEKLVEYYREYYLEKGIYENRLYPDIDEVLKTMAGSGFILSMATSKPQHYAEIIAGHFKINAYFTFICGAEYNGSREEKTDIIAKAIKKSGLKELAECVMVGDRKDDIAGARLNGMDAVGVLYGYGTREELLEDNPVYLAETPALLKEYFLLYNAI